MIDVSTPELDSGGARGVCRWYRGHSGEAEGVTCSRRTWGADGVWQGAEVDVSTDENNVKKTKACVCVQGQVCV